MLPRRSSTNSQRRSSILKPPKSRQPFQDVDFNASSPENSPDDTKKRRVSFAEKKHVKEFCDHKEQGTIWDSTYEEPDHSVLRSTEISDENVDRVSEGIKSNENADIGMNEADSNLLCNNKGLLKPETYVIMDPNSVENSSTKVFHNSGRDLELTDVIPCSRGTSNNSMSQRIFCEDVELEITEAIGGIEPTVSVKTIVDPHKREIRDYPGFGKVVKNTERTVLFDDSGEMNFTEVVTGRKIQTPIPAGFAVHQDLEKSDSFIENQTIIFDDSIMELTLTKSQTEVDLDQSKNVENVGKENIILDNNGANFECKTPQASEKTLFFDDFACDMTEAVNTVVPRFPAVGLTDRKHSVGTQGAKNHSVEIDARLCQDTNCSISSEEHNISKEPVLISDVQHGDKTIFFNDFGCEMTGVISTLKTRPAGNIVEKIDAEQIVPQQLLPIDRLTDIEMEIEPGTCRRVSSSSKPVESSPKSISARNERTKFFNDSAMEFTTAITREKNARIEVEETGTLEKDRTEIFDDCDVDVTEDVREVLCSLNSGSNSEERDKPLRTELESGELGNRKKRKSIENEADLDCLSSSNFSMSKSKKAENDLVQSLVRDRSFDVTNDGLSNSFGRNCKRLKVTGASTEESSLSTEDDFVTLQSEALEDLTKKTISQTSPNTQEVRELQILIPRGTEIEENRASSPADKCLENTEDVSVAAAPSSCHDDQERAIINDNLEPEVRESLKRTETDVSEEKSSFVEETLANLDSDSEAEIRELSRVYDEQQRSLTEKRSDLQSRLEPDTCLKNNDDCCFVMFSEELEKHAQRDNCIWSIRTLDTNKVLIDFISKSLVVVINLEASEELTSPRVITDIRIISLLADSSDENISMIHDMLLKKLDLDNLKRQHRTTQDVLPLLETISQRVKLLLDFMWEFEKLEDLHLINRSGNRISFRLHSYKVQLVIKITIDLEPFEDIGPNDVGVECVLGNIRETDIKQLITSVKKDHRFLTNYINDVKEYIALVAEK